MTIHNFGSSLLLGKEAEDNFLNIIAKLNIAYGDVRNDKTYQVRGIDFLVQRLVGDTNDFLRLDVKFDEASYKTGNVALETVSVMNAEGDISKQGWLYTSESEIFVFVQRTRVAWVYTFFSKRQLLDSLKLGVRKKVANKGYFSEVCVVKRGLISAPTFTHIFNTEPNIDMFRNKLEQAQQGFLI